MLMKLPCPYSFKHNPMSLTFPSSLLDNLYKHENCNFKGLSLTQKSSQNDVVLPSPVLNLAQFVIAFDTISSYLTTNIMPLHISERLLSNNANPFTKLSSYFDNTNSFHLESFIELNCHIYL